MLVLPQILVLGQQVEHPPARETVQLQRPEAPRREAQEQAFT